MNDETLYAFERFIEIMHCRQLLQIELLHLSLLYVVKTITVSTQLSCRLVLLLYML